MSALQDPIAAPAAVPTQAVPGDPAVAAAIDEVAAEVAAGRVAGQARAGMLADSVADAPAEWPTDAHVEALPAPFPADRLARLAARVCTAGQRPMQESRAPYTGQLVGEVPVCTEADVDEAVRRARAAQQEWAKLWVHERARIFLRYHDLVLERQDELLDLLQFETGKARVSGFEEVLDVAITSRYYAKAARRYLRAERHQGALPALTHAVEHHHPKGIVGIISPWNYPLTLAVSDAIPALLAGNGVVLKPDAQTPFIALYAVDLLIEAGLPPDLLQVVTGAGRVLGRPMIDRVDYMMFTGSTATGKLIARQCAERLVGFSAELGGKNAMIVCKDADLDKTVDGAVRACYSNSGQLCISIERMYVEDGIYDRFVSRFVERVRGMRLAATYDYSADMGSLISAGQLDAVASHVDEAVAKGAQVLAGGRRRPDIGPLFYEPTVLTGVTPDMQLSRDETFGPVVSIYRVRNVEEAIARANDTSFGLNASVWTRSARKGRRIASRLHAGTANVNEGYAAAWASIDSPMGGMKESGVGRRHGREGMLKYTESQTVATQRFLPLAGPGGIPPETYAKIMTKGLKFLKWVPFVP